MTITVTLDPGGVPKRTILEIAREACSFAGYEFEATPEEDASHLRQLNMLMATPPWSGLNYAQPITAPGRPEDSSGLAPEHVQAVGDYLALRIAPGLAKTLSAEAKAGLSLSWNLLFAQTATIPTMPMRRNTPRGSGAEWWQPWWPYINEDAA